MPSTTPEERTVRALLTALDAGDADRVLGLLTEEVRFQFGSAEPTIGREAVTGNAAALHATVASLAHELHAVWTIGEPDPAVICEMAVTYTRHHGAPVTLPCANVFRLRDGLIADYRIYMDINPVFSNNAGTQAGSDR